MFAAARQLEILDLRHFSAGAVRPLLLEQAAVWERRLLWDYRRSIELLLEYIDSRSLTGYIALRSGRVAGYAFGVCEAAKAVIGDVYAFGEGEQQANPICDQLLDHLLETLQATPGIDRVESQLLLFPDGALHNPLLSRGLRTFPRLFMVSELSPAAAAAAPTLARASRPDSNSADSPDVQPVPERWQPAAYTATAALIFDAYAGHTDSEINDQYRSVQGAQRFLHNIVYFPGCGIFDPANSWLLRNPGTGELQGVVLCSRVRHDAAHITQLCVAPRWRARGLGTRLLAHCLEHLAQSRIATVSLTVTASNTGARSLYERHSFRTLHRFEAWVWDKRR